MVKRRLGILVLVVTVLSALVPAMLAPSQADAMMSLGWFVYTPNHPSGCAPMPWDCYVVQVFG